MRVAKNFAAAFAAAFIALPVFAQSSDTSSIPQPSAASSKTLARKQNWQAEKAVRRALSRTKGLDSARITVVARNGAVSLLGTVPDASQIPLAQGAAQSVAQAKSVTNSLTVKEAGN